MRQVRLYVAVVAVFAFLAACSGTVKQEPPKTADAAVKSVVDGLQQNKPGTLWDALPASYQKDVSELVHTAAGKADPELWNAGWDLFRKLVTVAKNKKDFILKSPMMEESKKDLKLDELNKNWDVVVSLLDTVAGCDLGKIEKAKTLDVGAFLNTTGAELMTKLQKLSQMFPPQKMQDNPWVMLKTVKVTPVKAEGDTATLKIEGGGEPAQEFQFVKVEGKWIPMELAAFWKREITKAKQKLAETPKADPKETAQTLAMVKALGNAMTTMVDAKTQDEFNLGLTQVLGPFMMALGGAMQPQDMPGPTPEKK
jgi:hypothetical protein